MKRVILLLVILLVIGSFSSCGKPSDNQQSTHVRDTEEDVTGEKPDLPEDVNLKEKTFTIYTQPWQGYSPLDITDICPDEASTLNTISEAAFNRRCEVEEKLNCQIIEYVGDKTYQNGLTNIQNTIGSGMPTYDLLLIRAKQYIPLVTSGYLVDIQNIPWIDMKKPWWDKKSYDAMSIQSVAYAVCSDITVNDDLNIFNIYYNKKMAKDYGIDEEYGKSLYEMVDDQEWTLERMYTMAKQVSYHPDDVIGDPQNTDRDIYGFGYVKDASVAFLNAFGIFIAQVNNNGIPEFTLDSGDGVTKMQKLLEIMSDKSTSINFHVRSKNPTTDETKTFLDGRELFCIGGLYYASEMRQSEVDFGILPIPKYDEEQATYSAPIVGTALTVLAVPKTNTDLGQTGIFLEYFAYSGNRFLRPALYDILLKGILVKDEESVGMLDCIFASINYDSGLIFNFGDIADSIFDSYNKLNNTIVSNMFGYKSTVNNEIKKLVKSLNQSQK